MDAFTGEGAKLTSSLMYLSTLVAKARVEGELDLVETSVAKGLTSNREDIMNSPSEEGSKLLIRQGLEERIPFLFRQEAQKLHHEGIGC